MPLKLTLGRQWQTVQYQPGLQSEFQQGRAMLHREHPTPCTVCMCFTCIYVYVMFVPGGQGSQKRVSDPLELVTESYEHGYHVGPLQEQKVLTTSEPQGKRFFCPHVVEMGIEPTRRVPSVEINGSHICIKTFMDPMCAFRHTYTYINKLIKYKF